MRPNRIARKCKCSITSRCRQSTTATETRLFFLFRSKTLPSRISVLPLLDHLQPLRRVRATRHERGRWQWQSGKTHRLLAIASGCFNRHRISFTSIIEHLHFPAFNGFTDRYHGTNSIQLSALYALNWLRLGFYPDTLAFLRRFLGSCCFLSVTRRFLHRIFSLLSVSSCASRHIYLIQVLQCKDEETGRNLATFRPGALREQAHMQHTLLLL